MDVLLDAKINLTLKLPSPSQYFDFTSSEVTKFIFSFTETRGGSTKQS